MQYVLCFILGFILGVLLLMFVIEMVVKEVAKSIKAKGFYRTDKWTITLKNVAEGQ